MLTRILVSLGAIALIIASAYGNYEQVKNAGYTWIAAVIGAEIFKAALPLAIREQYEQGHEAQLAATLFVWAVVTVFSFTNAFGNAIVRRADASAIRDAEAVTRSVQQIAADISKLPAMDCTPQTQIRKTRVREDGRNKTLVETVALPLSPLCSVRTALQQELSIATKTQEARGGTVEVRATGDPARDGIITLAAMLGYYPKQHYVPIYVSLIWVALLEFGSMLGPLAVPRARKRE